MNQSRNTTMNDSSLNSISPRRMGGFKMSWLLYGAAAYYGIRYLNRRGILSTQGGKAMDFINRGIDTVKHSVSGDRSRVQSSSSMGSSMGERSVSDEDLSSVSGSSINRSDDLTSNRSGLSH